MRPGADERSAALTAWAELLRLPAVFTVPGDALAGAAVVGCRPNRGTLLAVGTSLCLYEAGMALNDWSDREEDARERPSRPLPSGRIAPGAALTAAAALTGAGLGLAALAGRSAFATATALAGTVWAYDLGLKHTRAASATMATARALDLLLGTAATRTRAASQLSPPSSLPAGADPASGLSLALSAPWARDGTGAPASPPPSAQPPGEHTGAAGTAVARTPAPGGGGHGETNLGRSPVPRREVGVGLHAAGGVAGTARGREGLAAAALLGAHTLAVTAVSRHETTGGSSRAPLAALAAVGSIAAATAWRRHGGRPDLPAQAAAAAYVATAARPLLHAALNPSPPLLQRAVGGGIRAMVPLQAALTARAGAPGTALAVAALAPLARRFARKVSLT